MHAQAYTLHMFLAEVNLSVTNSMLSFILKSENAKLAPHFMQYFFGALVGYSYVAINNLIAFYL